MPVQVHLALQAPSKSVFKQRLLNNTELATKIKMTCSLNPLFLATTRHRQTLLLPPPFLLHLLVLSATLLANPAPEQEWRGSFETLKTNSRHLHASMHGHSAF